MSLVVVSLSPLPSSAGRVTAIHPLPNQIVCASTALAGASASIPFAKQNPKSSALCELLAVNDRAELLLVSPLQGGVRVLSTLRIPEFDPLKPIQIVTDAHGRYAAVSNRYGRYAALFALPDSAGAPSAPAEEIWKLERGDYYTDKSLFPLAFAELDGRSLLIHGSDWNRVELTELPSLRPLAARAFPGRDGAGEADESGSPTPFLNYFHGRLLTSPNGGRIADTGWVWQPVGLVGTWSLREWLDNPWESENGASLKHFFQTEDWDLPAAWIDNERLAVWGKVDTDLLDEDDYEEISSKPVIVVYDTRTGSVSRIARDVLPYLRSTAFVPSSECFPYPLGDMAAEEDRLFFWGRGVPLYVWTLPPVGAVSADLAGSRPETTVESSASNSAVPALPDSAPHSVTEIEFHDAVYHPSAKMFIDLQADGRLSAFRLSDADSSPSAGEI